MQSSPRRRRGRRSLPLTRMYSCLTWDQSELQRERNSCAAAASEAAPAVVAAAGTRFAAAAAALDDAVVAAAASIGQPRQPWLAVR